MAIDISAIEPSLENAWKYFPPQDYGPLWKIDEEGYYILPKYSLGWDVIAWMETKLNALAGDGKLQLTNEQRRLILWFYSVDKRGKYTYRNAVWQAFKGAGKSPFAAVICAAEFLGPVRFSHWGEDGQPVGKRDPKAHVQLLAVSKDQTRNTFSILATILGKQLKEEHDVDLQREIAYAHGGRNKLEAVGASFKSLEGVRPTFMIFDEIQWWTPGIRGPQLYHTALGNLTKTAGRYLATMNAYIPGDESVGQEIREGEEKVWAGLAEPEGATLYMSREAHPEAPLTKEWIPHILETVMGDAWWTKDNIETITQDMLNPVNGPLETRRRFYNQVVTGEDAFFSVPEWDNALAEGCTGTVYDLSPGDEITLGFDGSKSNDATALVAVRVEDKLIVPLMVEQKPHGSTGKNWQVDRQLVNEAVLRAFAEYEVRAFYADVSLWESFIQDWNEEYGKQLEVSASPHSIIGFDMRGARDRVSQAFENYRSAIIHGRLRHNGDKVLRNHALNAHMGHNGKGLIARKEKHDSPKKIDTMIASYLAYTALTDLLEKSNRGGKKRHTPGRIITGNY